MGSNWADDLVAQAKADAIDIEAGIRTRDEVRADRGLSPLDIADDDLDDEACNCCRKCCCCPVVTYTYYWPTPQLIYQTYPIYVTPITYPTGTWTVGTGGTWSASGTTNIVTTTTTTS